MMRVTPNDVWLLFKLEEWYMDDMIDMMMNLVWCVCCFCQSRKKSGGQPGEIIVTRRSSKGVGDHDPMMV